jgi:hypothetical protein
MTNDPFSPDKIKRIKQKLDQQEKNRKAFLIKGIKTVPVSQDVLDKLIFEVGEAYEIIIHHPGYDLCSKIESLERALGTYHKCHADLITGLDIFDIASKDATLFQRNRARDLEEHEARVRKEVFSLTSAAAILVDMTRHITRHITISDFDEKRTSNFNEIQHEFIKGLRNNLNHVLFFEPGWTKRNSMKEETSHFEYSSAKLLREGDFNEKARDYILSQEEVIDVRNLFTSYHICIDGFYEWLIPEIKNKLPIEITDYQRCRKEMQINSVRCWYRLLFTQIISPKTDLYSHLHKHLTQEELEEINALPNCSKEQIDRIIEMVDEYGAIDDELRELIYKGFKVKL